MATNGNNNTAILGIVAVVIIVLLAVLWLFWDRGERPADGPDIELEVQPPAEPEAAPADTSGL